MASLVLGAAGAVIGSFVGMPELGYMVGSALGAALFPPPGQDGPRLSDLKVQNSSYGSAIPIAYGRYRIAGQMIWADDFVEHENSGDSGSGGGGVTQYTYTCSFAMGICEGPKGISRIWMDGKLVYDAAIQDMEKKALFKASSYKIYFGDEAQLPDPTIEASLGVGNVPAYRGMLYMVFTDLELAPYGNRVPNITFEVGGIGPVSECPPPPDSYSFNYVFDAPAYKSGGPNYDEWMVYVESTDEFWLSGNQGVAFMTVDAATWTSTGTIPVADGWQDGIYSSEYDPKYDKVWAINSGKVDRNAPDGKQRDGLARYDVKTRQRELLLETDYWFGSMPTCLAVNREDGTVWAGGRADVTTADPDSPNSYIYHFDQNGNVLSKTKLTGRMTQSVVVDSNGNGWAWSTQAVLASGENQDQYLSMFAKVGGAETIIYHPAKASGAIWGGIAADLLHNAIWIWDGVRGDGNWPYDAYLRKWDIATGAFVVNEFVPYTYDTMFTFDNVRNMVWMRTNASGMQAGGIEGHCGINGEISHASNPGDMYVGDRKGVIYRRPGNNIYFDTYDDNGYAIGEYAWVAPPSITLSSTITLGEVVADVSRRVGLGPMEVDVSELTEELDGFCIANNMAGRSAVEPLSTVYFFDSVESGDRMRFPKRGHAPVIAIPTDKTLLEGK